MIGTSALWRSSHIIAPDCERPNSLWTSASITALLNEIGELTRIAKWYQRANKPSEHETVAYLVVPLLRALGWTPQRMAVEWNRVAMSQAMSYSDGKTACHRLIVTDGLRYGVYTRIKAEPFQLHAYLNLTRLRHSYPIYECSGAEEALLAMAPEWQKGRK